jgi:hypothetical protein
MAWGTAPINLALDDGTFKHVKEKENYTTFESQGYRESGTAVQALEFSLKGVWNAAVNYLDPTVGNPALPGIYARDDGGPLKAYISLADPTFWLIAVVTVPSATVDLAMAQKFAKFAMEGESNSSFSLPTGLFGQITG